MLHTIDKEPVDKVSEDADLLTMGITPSGRGVLHMGHYLTVFNVLRSLERFRSQRAQIFVDDREFNSQVVPALPEEMVTARVEDKLRQFIADASKFLADDTIPQRVDLTRMSDFYLQNGAEEGLMMGQDLFDLLIAIRTKVGKAFPKMKIGGIAGMRALCPKCHQGKSSFKGASRLHNQNEIVSFCENNECGGFEREYSVDVSRGDTNWAIFYTLVGLRDVTLLRRDDESILHVYGGDYGVPWGRGYIPKGYRISSLIDDVLDEGQRGRINHFVGPILVTETGQKLSKSSENGTDIQFDLEILARILDKRERLVKI